MEEAWCSSPRVITCWSPFFRFDFPIVWLVRLYVICRYEWYYLADLKKAYESDESRELSYPSCWRYQREVDQTIWKWSQFFFTQQQSKWETEYIIPSGQSLPSEVITAAYHEEGISKPALLRAAGKQLHHEMAAFQRKRNWPRPHKTFLKGWWSD